jgi:hypothetical protein
MTAFFGARLSSRCQQMTGERRGPVNRSENGDRQERVDYSRSPMSEIGQFRSVDLSANTLEVARLSALPPQGASRQRIVLHSRRAKEVRQPGWNMWIGPRRDYEVQAEPCTPEQLASPARSIAAWFS